MAKVYSLIIDAPLESVWAFMEDFSHWGPLVPGYVSHKIVNMTQSNWVFTTDFGFIKKKLEFEVEILSKHAPKRMTFQVEGKNEGFNGHGSIEMKSLKSNRTFINVSLDIQATGTLAKLIKPMLKSNPPKMTNEFKKEITEKILQYNL
ncbi:SRPBCC family protein [Robertmurraya sp. DFI.2.37]|uniref:CoxG family protein n=1 Tax=Robertmurraya sp. DFI.2.37 TaxID=3031819 RepID=UPI0012449C31|nr:SRPBCC family protein [Robertmurraya sp. DFI.2.37]MDF1507097.1 SRPBCC family protein [Robertmurraya sp. DFI.2.37]